jgi:Xaa-Pro aminopeptidase
MTMILPELHTERLMALRRSMSEKNIPALLIKRPENRHYLSGFSATDPQLDESSGCLLITQDQALLLTDFRYQIQAEREAPGYELVIYSNGMPKSVGELSKKFQLNRIGFEEDHLTVGTHELLKSETQATWLPLNGLVESFRMLKDTVETELMTRALRITEEAFSRLTVFIQPGMTEIELKRFLEDTMIELGADGPAFETIAASGPNAALPHAVPERRHIREHETIVIDFGAKFKGYCSDMTRTLVLGQPPDWIKEIYALVRKAQRYAIEHIKAGMKTDEADSLARQIIEDGGFGPHFGHSLGHGLGLATHEKPSLSRFRSMVLEPGMIVTIEPGIYIKDLGGVRLEEMIQITRDGCMLLNKDETFYAWGDE